VASPGGSPHAVRPKDVIPQFKPGARRRQTRFLSQAGDYSFDWVHRSKLFACLINWSAPARGTLVASAALEKKKPVKNWAG